MIISCCYWYLNGYDQLGEGSKESLIRWLKMELEIQKDSPGVCVKIKNMLIKASQSQSTCFISSQ